jgi:hypothetical protein
MKNLSIRLAPPPKPNGKQEIELLSTAHLLRGPLRLTAFQKTDWRQNNLCGDTHAGLFLAGQRCLLYLGEQALAATMLRRTALRCHRETTVVVAVVSYNYR